MVTILSALVEWPASADVQRRAETVRIRRVSEILPQVLQTYLPEVPSPESASQAELMLAPRLSSGVDAAEAR